MTASELLVALRERGAAVGVEGEELVVRAPRGALDPGLRLALARLKPALMAQLKNAHTSDTIDALTEMRHDNAALPVSPARPEQALPPVHDADDPWTKPAAPCMVCGQVRWRVWCHDDRKVWQWICNGCRPLVVINPDGTRWRS